MVPLGIIAPWLAMHIFRLGFGNSTSLQCGFRLGFNSTVARDAHFRLGSGNSTILRCGFRLGFYIIF